MREEKKMENNNNFSEQTLNLLRPMLDIDTLEAQIQLLDDVMDDYLDVSPDKNLKDLKKSIES